MTTDARTVVYCKRPGFPGWFWRVDLGCCVLTAHAFTRYGARRASRLAVKQHG